MSRNLTYFLLPIVTLLFSACKPKFTKEEVSKGEINPTRFIMIGGGHTAGYMDDALYSEGQENSLANLISKQLALVGGEQTFYQALVSPNSVGIGLSGFARFILGFKTDCKGVEALSPLRISSAGDASILSVNTYNSMQKFQNFGIPGLKLNNVSTPNYGSINPFFGRMASSTTTTVLSDALASEPTFFSVFLGIEDVLDFAKSGGTDDNMPTVSAFENDYTQVVESLLNNGAKGVLAKIPDITKMPYFTTIPWNGITLDASNTELLNSNFNPLFYYSEGSNPFLIVDSTANEFFYRQTLPNELMLLSLPLDSVKCNLMGVFVPIRDEFVLDLDELQTLRNRIAGYNAVISSLATQYGLAIVNLDQFASQLLDGFVYNGVSMSAKFVSGGAYSLDGIHFNAKGNALLANEFLKSINQKYNSRIPLLNANSYNGIYFP
jgi:hypothetical protein